MSPVQYRIDSTLQVESSGDVHVVHNLVKAAILAECRLQLQLALLN